MAAEFTTQQTTDSEANELTLRVLKLGAAAGMRTMNPLATIAYTSLQGDFNLPYGLQKYVSPQHVTKIAMAAVGEVLMDKAPIAPNRTALPILLPRLISGALAGAIVAKKYRQDPVRSALIGAGAALATSFLMVSVRKFANQNIPVLGPLVAISEDVLATGLSYTALK